MNAGYFELLQNLSPMMVSLISLVILVSTLNLRKKTRYQEQQIRQLSQELNALLCCSRGISEKLHHYQHQFRHLTERQDKLEVGEPEYNGYKQAIALYNRGASEDEMLSACDLSRGELNLIAHLQKAREQKSARLQ